MADIGKVTDDEMLQDLLMLPKGGKEVWRIPYDFPFLT